ncbi:Hypothetical protein, putative [Bodo saltans]|uniref:Uncharacterized protein n=1 Tax=Bodo saltans TaxID=75058 RepID=A0A0S4JK55_BODSA|nr:Hypothetical protein, putative [Bodo saltans]|eukprot:CUG89372.1 Hypothetical protein, putative [Bodo saltans]
MLGLEQRPYTTTKCIKQSENCSDRDPHWMCHVYINLMHGSLFINKCEALIGPINLNVKCLGMPQTECCLIELHSSRPQTMNLSPRKVRQQRVQ